MVDSDRTQTQKNPLEMSCFPKHEKFEENISHKEEITEQSSFEHTDKLTEDNKVLLRFMIRAMQFQIEKTIISITSYRKETVLELMKKLICMIRKTIF